MFHETFDWTTISDATTAELVAVNIGILRESWSGYAIERSGTVKPLIVPGINTEGRTNVASHLDSSVRFWLTPYWASRSLGGTGPGQYAPLIELTAIDGKEAIVVWSLQVSPDGSTLALFAPGDTAPSELPHTEIAWLPTAHCLGLNFGPSGTSLFVDGELAAQGKGTAAIPPNAAALVIGSSWSGNVSAECDLEELYVFGQPLTEEAVAFYYVMHQAQAALGPLSEAEWQALPKAAAAANDLPMMRLLGGTTECVTNVPVYITNIWSVLDANQGWTVTFDIQGGTNGLLYDVFAASSLSGNGITNSQWTWLERGPTCSTYQYTNQLETFAFYVLGTPQDRDDDELSDAFEQLVSKTDIANDDTDGDEMPDGWEIGHALNPLLDDASDDPDGDWLTNLQEYQAISNPHDTMVVAWGDNAYGQCDVPLGVRNAVDSAGGFEHSLVVQSDGTMVVWGSGTHSQTNMPMDLTNGIHLAAGPYHSVAVKADGTVETWGKWWDGDFFDLSLPEDLTNVCGVAAGGDHDIVLLADGTVRTWGYYEDAPYNTVPPGLSGVQAVAAGWAHSVALLNDGTVRAWGYGFASLDWNVTNVPPDLSNVTAVAAGAYHTLALRNDGTVTARGAGNGEDWLFSYGQSIVPEDLSNVVAIAAGGFHSIALRSDGTLVTWGDLEPPAFMHSNLVAIGSGVLHGLAARGGRLTPLIVTQPTNQVAPEGWDVTFRIVSGWSGLAVSMAI